MREIELCPGCYELTVKQPKDWFCIPCVSGVTFTVSYMYKNTTNSVKGGIVSYNIEIHNHLSLVMGML